MNRYQDLIDRADGYIVGHLIVDADAGFVGVKTKDDEELRLASDQSFEVLAGDNFHRYTVDDALAMKDDAGWPLLAGLYCRAANKEVK